MHVCPAIFPDKNNTWKNKPSMGGHKTILSLIFVTQNNQGLQPLIPKINKLQ